MLHGAFVPRRLLGLADWPRAGHFFNHPIPLEVRIGYGELSLTGTNLSGGMELAETELNLSIGWARRGWSSIRNFP